MSVKGIGGRSIGGRKAKNGQKTRPETIECKKRAAQALELRIEGHSFSHIAEAVGYNSTQACFSAVTRAIREIIREPAQELVKIDLERLDGMWTASYKAAKNGDEKAVLSCMRIMERRAKLLGLDTPSKHELTGKDGTPLPSSPVVILPSKDSSDAPNPENGDTTDG